MKLVPINFFDPKFVYWRDEDAVVDYNGMLGVLLKERPEVVQYQFRWLVG